MTRCRSAIARSLHTAHSRSKIRWGRVLGWLLPLALWEMPSLAAEQIALSYGILERRLSIDTLDTFADSTDIPRELRSYARQFTPEQIEQFRTLLNTSFDLSPVAVSQFLYTPQGEQLLAQLGEVVRTESGLSGCKALRAALILAAFDTEDGLTPLTALRYFPLDSIRIDLARTSQILVEINRQVSQTQSAIALIDADATWAIDATLPPDYARLPDPRQPGTYRVDVYTFEVVDEERDRHFPVDLYLPRQLAHSPPTPVVVISHGLGSNRSTFAYLAQHLASHGFAVAVPEHPGSNTAQLEALVNGQADAVTRPDEFVNRPLDITRLLDHLEERTKLDPGLTAKLDLTNVGILGQSLGGYTAFTLAGVPLNPVQLRSDCGTVTPVSQALNLSLLLQCEVLTLDLPPAMNFHDPRIRAIFSINTVGSSLLDRTTMAELEVPVMVVSGGADTVTPALPEQIEPFARLTSPQRYLLMMENATHFSAIDVPDGESTTVELPPTLVGPNPAIAHHYLSAFSLAFFGKYLQQETSLAPFLEPAYARHISQAALPINLVQDFPVSYLAILRKN